MARFKIPSTRLWQGITDGEWLGNLYLGKSIDLHRNKGKVLLAESLTAVFHNNASGGDADLTLPLAFVRTAADNTSARAEFFFSSMLRIDISNAA